MGHHDGTAVFAQNTIHASNFAGKVESKNGGGLEPFTSVHMAHPNGAALVSTTQSDAKDSFAGKFIHGSSKTEVVVADWYGRAFDIERTGDLSRLDKELIRLRAGAIKGPTKDFKSHLELGSVTGEAIKSVSRGTDRLLWNTKIAHMGEECTVNLAQGTGLGISSTSTSTAASSSPHNAEFIYTNAANVKIGFKTGEGLKSLSTSGDVYNAHFTHSEKSHLQVAGFDGNVIRSTSKGNTWNAIFEDVSARGMKTAVSLVHPEHGTAIHAVTKSGTAFNTELSHQSKSSVNLVHGSGLAIDSASEYVPNNKIETPGVTTAAPTPAPAPSMLDTSEELLQTEEENVGQSVSQPLGRFNARFLTKTRSSAHVAKDDGTALELRTLAPHGRGPTMSVERGATDATYQRVLLGQAYGAAIQGYTAGTQQYTAEFKGTESTVSIAKGSTLIDAHSNQSPTDMTKTKPLVSIKNNVQTILTVQNSGRVIVGDKLNRGSLYVSGNARVQGSLHTVHAGETMNLAEEIVRLRKQNEEMREMMLAMKAQNEAALARMSSMEDALAARR